MTRKAKGKAHKSSRKQPPKNGQDQPAPPPRMRDRLKRGLLVFLNGIIEALIRLVTALSEWVGGSWRSLTPRGQQAVIGVLWLAGIAFGIYSAWFARKYSMPALVIRWGILRVEARFGVLLLLILLSLPFTVLLERVSRWRSKQTFPRLATPGFVYRWRDRVVPPLAQARWLYVRRQDIRALERTQTLFAQEPDNAAARELLALIETRIARQAEAQQENVRPEDAPKTPPVSVSERLLDSNLPTLAARFVVVAILCLSLGVCIFYVRFGIVQGWRAPVWIGHDREGNPVQTYVWEALLAFLLITTICLAYLMYGEDGVASTAAWKKLAGRKATANKPVERKT